MTSALTLHEYRLFPSDPSMRSIARRLYNSVKDLPIVSPHGHTDPNWFADDEAFPNPAELLVKPDHYVFRMLYSQGMPLEALGIAPSCSTEIEVEQDPREIWRRFASNYHLFRGTPSQLWHDWVYKEVFNINSRLSAATADHYYDVISERLESTECRPRALMDAFNIEVIATTEGALDPLAAHKKIMSEGWGDRVVTTFRPDDVVDPEFDDFVHNVEELGRLTGCDTSSYQGYLNALEQRRIYFKQHGATATDHGHITAKTAVLSNAEAEDLFNRILVADPDPGDAELFRAHMLVEMARMSLSDGLVMQLHPGSCRNHNKPLYQMFGRDIGADIPTQTDYVNALKPLLNAYGSEPGFRLIIFTLDESAYSRELAPLAGHYPALYLGPPWWFHDSPEGMRRYREQVIETAGFYNTAGFNDDTRAFLSIPARHDVARRMDCVCLARLVAEHRLDEDDAEELARDLAYNLAKKAYRL